MDNWFIGIRQDYYIKDCSKKTKKKYSNIIHIDGDKIRRKLNIKIKNPSLTHSELKSV